MKFLGLGLPELLLILVVTVLIFAPKNLPKLGSMLGRSVKKLRTHTDDSFEEGEEIEVRKQPV